MEQQAITVHYQRMEEWLNDRKAVLGKKHKNEYTRLLELAPKLEQLVRYDIPAQQRQQKKLTNALDDSFRVIEDATKAACSLEEKQMRLLQEYGLEHGGNTSDDALNAAVDARITASTALLNEGLREFGASVHLAAFREAYGSIAREFSMGMYDRDVFSEHLPWLERVFEERLYASTVVEQQHCQPMVVQEDSEPCSIDWGDMGVSGPIDIDAAMEIKWDENEGEEDLYGPTDGESNADDEKPPAKIVGIFSMNVSNAAHRQHILTELQALRCFASERSLMGDDSLAEAVAVAEALEQKLTTSTEAAFVRMKASATLRLSFLDEVQRLQRGITAAAMRNSSAEDRVKQIQDELRRLAPQVDALLDAARACRDECLAELLKMFPGRTVTIVGDINKYL
ncbi:putative dynein heavy chain [Trypanosoma grayi]|uniref:putative dynein heavy chain n=1 Tax=Trypanosoma grayi TaxID=71804 RepID=UPI0004F3F263|nr:putative dynein heavy chain [Trypanosoma grayi]KEG15465.1 putative dynein heavy chain [Trypanosoma grayi]